MSTSAAGQGDRRPASEVQVQSSHVGLTGYRSAIAHVSSLRDAPACAGAAASPPSTGDDQVLDVWFPTGRLGLGRQRTRRWRRPPRPARLRRDDRCRGLARRSPSRSRGHRVAGRPAGGRRRRLPAPAPALPPADQAARAPTSTASSGCSATWPGPRPARARRTGCDELRLLARGSRPARSSVFGVDKFPRMTDYVVPTGVRIADADRVRLGAHLAAGTTVMHEGFVNFNAGTLGTSMVEGRISPGVVVGDGSDIGGGASIMGTLSGGGKEVVRIGERCLIGANAGVGISLGDDCVVEAGCYVTAGSKVTLPDGRGGQGARALRRRRAAVPAQLGDRRAGGAAAQGPRHRAQRRAPQQRLTVNSPLNRWAGSTPRGY